MGILKRLICLLLLLAGISSQISAAPAFDTGNQAQTTITAPSDNDAGQSATILFSEVDQPAAILYDAPKFLQTAEHSFWDIGLQQNVGTSKNPREEKGFTTGMKEVLTVFDNPVASANYNSANWTANDDIGRSQHFFSFSHVAKGFPHTWHFLRC